MRFNSQVAFHPKIYRSIDQSKTARKAKILFISQPKAAN